MDLTPLNMECLLVQPSLLEVPLPQDPQYPLPVHYGVFPILVLDQFFEFGVLMGLSDFS